MLTKTVLRAGPAGIYNLVEVPFDWRPGDAVPDDASQESFASAAAAMSELADRGRKAQRVHVPMPELKRRAPAGREPN